MGKSQKELQKSDVGYIKYVTKKTEKKSGVRDILPTNFCGKLFKLAEIELL